jgi:hypothetical protein
MVYDNNPVRYFKNGVQKRAVAHAPGPRLYVSTSLYTKGAQLDDVAFGPSGSSAADPITGSLTQPSAVVVTDSAGNGGNYALAGGAFQVFEGAADVTGLGPVYSMEGATGGLSISIHASSGVYTVSGLLGDSGSAVLRAVYAGVTLDRTYSIAKAKQGVSGGGDQTLLQMIQAESLTSGLKLCLDAADSASYSGSGQSWLDTSGNGYDFFRGATSASEASDPAFFGAPGAKSLNEYWQNDGAGDCFTYDSSVETWMSNLHKDGAKWSLIFVYDPNNSVSEAIVRTFPDGANNAGIQVSHGIGPKQPRTIFVQVLGGSGGLGLLSSFNISSYAGATGWTLVAVSFDETSAAGLKCVVNGVTLPSQSAVISGPAANAAQPMRLFLSSIPTAAKFGALAMWEGIALTTTQLEALMERLNVRYSAY